MMLQIIFAVLFFFGIPILFSEVKERFLGCIGTLLAGVAIMSIVSFVFREEGLSDYNFAWVVAFRCGFSVVILAAAFVLLSLWRRRKDGD